MSRYKKFGKLVASLRRGIRDETNNIVTQAKLAKKVNATASVISNLERGDKTSLEPGLLVNLADAFQLSSRECEGFFLAAIGTAQGNMLHSRCDAQETLATILAVLKNLAVPAFVVDHYDNVIAANQLILSLYSYTDLLRSQASQVFSGYNILRFVFSRQSLFAQSVSANKDAYLLQSIHFFRAISLPYRATPYYQKLINAFLTDPDMALFRTYLAQAGHDEDDFVFESNHAIVAHSQFGELSFYSPTITPIHTSCGDLFLIVYLPASPATSECFHTLFKQCGGNVITLEHFPIDELYPDDGDENDPYNE